MAVNFSYTLRLDIKRSFPEMNGGGGNSFLALVFSLLVDKLF